MTNREEMGKRRHPDATEIIKVAKELGVTLFSRQVWTEFTEFVEAAVRHADEAGFRRGQRAKRLATPEKGKVR